MRSDSSPRRKSASGGILLFLGLLLTAGGAAILGGSFFSEGIGGAGQSVTATAQGQAQAAATQDGELLAPSPQQSEEPQSAQAPKPTGIRIPAINVEADMIALGLEDDGSIEVPTDFAQTGWWADGPEPGEQGPAVVLGHVDSRSGPAVFFELTELQPGDEVIIDRVDGSNVAYRVDRIEQHAKDRFPTEAVYGDTEEPQLRLVTCGGDFDSAARSYRDNIVVFASPI